ncbi:MAG: ABC transporter permease [Dysgonamonadaceae bacterium]|jgi:ABC-type lipoprotein release transport system permease subunit|nr:ABC transporter permease [Dysgonamonadaceae bacterium]
MIKLAWRNSWRNKRRTLITMASVFFAVCFCTVMSSFSEGVWDKMIENTLRTQTGHIQIHGKGYWDDKITDNFLTMDTETLSRLETVENIGNVSPRLETFAMASMGMSSKGIAVVGISPRQEAAKSNLPARLTKGRYLSETDDGILIGEGLSRYLKADTGDTLALVGQGYQGAGAVGLFPVRGVLHLMLSEMDNGVAYVALPAAQQFIGMPDGYSGVLIAVRNNDHLDETIHAVKQIVDGQHVDVYPWHFTMERLLQTSRSDKAFTKVILFVLYLIAGFGILGAVIMLTNERKREFGMMISLGMQRMRLAAIVALELVMTTFSGVVSALLVCLVFTRWFALHPIAFTGEMAQIYATYGMEPLMPASTAPAVFIKQIVIVLILTALAAIYPVTKIMKLKIMDRS